MDAAEARRRFERARVARLATVDDNGHPHLVPMVFAVADDIIYSAVDDKPKTSRLLRRLANVQAHPEVAVLVDHYDDADWTALWWARADGTGRVVDAETAEGVAAIDALAARYAPYRQRRPGGPVLAVRVERWSGWSASP